MSFLKKIFGDPNARILAELGRAVEEINLLESAYRAKSDAELRETTATLRARLAAGEPLDTLLPDAFAAAREASRRTLGQRHYDVQLLGAIVLHRGQIAEMRTGEGKTLTATAAVYLNALTGKGVHVVTVNDYLARRDAVWMGQIYHALGLTVGTIQHETAYRYDPDYQVEPRETATATETEMEASGVHEGTPEDEERDTRGAYRVEMSFLRPISRQEAYAADITYGTNNEFGFDYLRDNMVGELEQMVQRPLEYAIVDEVDSILIDEARTPLIISAPAEDSTDQYYRFAELVRQLRPEEHFTVDEKMRSAFFTEAGQDAVTQLLGFDPWAQSDLATVHHLEQALRAEALFKRDKEYVVREGEIVIVDEFTGRLMFGRRYSEGLHQAIEAKEGVKIQRESRTLATVTFQNYFRLYKKLAGMTGTAATEAEEFGKIYKLEVVQIQPNKPSRRTDSTDMVYKNEKAKYQAVVAEVKARHERGQPVLIGTISIEKNEILSQLLEREGVPHALLNAKNHEREAETIAQAGRKGAVTVATNMAGRGVDIILGGNPPDALEAEAVKAAGGLHIIGTERHEARRIDNQLRGRSGRQGDPGSSQFFLSLEDDLMRIFASDRVKRMMETLRIPEEVPIESKMVGRLIESAQRKVEGHNFDIRKHLLEYDDVLNKHREAIYRRRREILDVAAGRRAGKTARAMILEMVEEEIERLVHLHTSEERGARWDLAEIYNVAATIFPLPAEARTAIAPPERQPGDKLADVKTRTAIIEQLAGLARTAYEGLEKRISNPELMREIEKSILLRSIDGLWIEHLDAMEHLRTGIGLRGYGQRDPLVEYKREAYRMFQELLQLIAKQIVFSIYRVGVAAEAAPQFMRQQNVQLSAPAKEGDAGAAMETHAAGKHQKIGRNDPCPCGSGKKFKKCHGT
ncbi:preprotein translocase subunit SecA [Patescibacteria group bacterium]|nr:MAG: preprotein translocase subunit SecA [Patescibacteria group bacterium]